MRTINLKRIRTASGLRPSDLAAALFPDHKKPYNAFNYVESGKGYLNSWQIDKLAELVGVPIGLLFDDADWQMGVPAGSHKRVVQFKTYDYFAELDLDTMTTTVARNGQVFFEKIIHGKGVELTEYLASLTDLIIKYK